MLQVHMIYAWIQDVRMKLETTVDKVLLVVSGKKMLDA